MDPASPYFVPAAFRPSSLMHAFVGEVREMGLRTAIISNVVVEWLPWWDAVTPADAFDVVIHSCSVGRRKPNPAIYLHTLEQLQLPANEVMFFDDFPAMASAGEAVGMVTVRVEDHAAAIEHARRLLRQ
jgi:putative hydrolase of the HAD superfamily